MMRISKELYSDLEAHSADDWDAETAQELLALYPSYFEALGAEKSHLKSVCNVVRNYAAALKINERKHVFKLIIAALGLGAHFVHDPRYEEIIATSLRHPTMPADRRVVLFTQEVQRIMSLTDEPGRFQNVSKQLQSVMSRSEVCEGDHHISKRRPRPIDYADF